MANGIAPIGLTPGFATSLGLGDQLSDQVRDETEEERKKRLQGLFGPQGTPRFGLFSNAGPGSIFGNTAASSIFGSYGR
jgi:hypothetical protein